MPLSFFKSKPEDLTAADIEPSYVEMSGTRGVNGADYDTMAQAFNLFTGNTVPGTMSLPKVWGLDYYALRERSWQAYTENELAAAYIDRLRQFVINAGLRMQYEPSPLLEDMGITFSDEDKEAIERDFAVYASSPAASYDNRGDLHAKADEAYLNVNVAGDLLVVLRVVRGDIQVQHIDGKNLVNPYDQSVLLRAAAQMHTIVNGVEFDKRGREVAYHVRQDYKFRGVATGNWDNTLKVERIPAYGQSGRLIAFRPCRNNQRIGGTRGKPLLSPILQKLEIMRRCELAELLAFEVNSDFVMAIEHDENSSGLNPLANLPRGGGRHTDGQAKELDGAGWSTDSGDKIAGRVTNVTHGMMVNMGRGQRIKAVDAKRPNVNATTFLDALQRDSASAIGIPHEVAKMLFSSNYSASRAALEMFKIIIQFERKCHPAQYYGTIARERMRLRALQGKIKMPKEYIKAIMERDEVMLSAFENFRFTGVVVPHVDPLKEVKAAIERIDAGLSTHDKETEGLGTGDFEANVSRLKKEKELLDSAGLTDILETKDGENNGDSKKQSEASDRAEEAIERIERLEEALEASSSEA